MGFKIESALFEACVLSVVMKEDTYGYKKPWRSEKDCFSDKG